MRAVARIRKEEPSLDRAAHELQAAVADLVRVYQFRDRERICCHDVSVTQCYALETLVEHGPLRLVELAERLFLDKSTTSRVVQSLLRKGYIEQRPDVRDRRATSIVVTPKGRALCGRIVSDLVDQQKQLLRDLEPDTRKAVVTVLRRLADAADARFRSGSSTSACCAVPDDAGC